MTFARATIALLTIGIMMLQTGSGIAHGAEHQKATARAGFSDLGPLTVRPKQARIRDWVTISGKTRGPIQWLPPYVLLQRKHTKVVHFGPGPCGGRLVVPAEDKTVKLGGGVNGKASQKNPPVGTVWSVRFRVPRRMNQPYGNRQARLVPTPLAKYRIVAIAASMDALCGPVKQSSTYVSINSFRVVK